MCWNRFCLFILSLTIIPQIVQAHEPPAEPIAIGTVPQLLVDDWIVDNHFGIKYKRDDVTRKFHAPQKHPLNPLIANDGGYPCVHFDAEHNRYQMWYQVHRFDQTEDLKAAKSQYAVAYAESKDGLHWEKPVLNLYSWGETGTANNIVYKGVNGKRASAPVLLDVPEDQKRGYRYLFSYRTGGAGKGLNGIRVVGSRDGIHWEQDSDILIGELHSDTLNCIVYDEAKDRYLMYCRAKDRYRRFRGNIIDTGASRRVALWTGPSLLEEWTGSPKALIVPDEADSAAGFNFIYGMPVQKYAGVYFGTPWMFRMNDIIVPQLAFSRDGINFERLHSRPALIELGEEGSWDDGFIVNGNWIEKDDEWWLYYAAYDGPHGTRERTPGIGLVTIQKERIISRRGPDRGGVVITRLLTWPGGDLLLNANATEGVIRVRVSQANRDLIEGFDYEQSDDFNSDEIRGRIRWKDRSLDELAGREIRLEFYLEKADLFAFVAGGESKTSSTRIEESQNDTE
jgi:hypothetical protein